MNENRNEPWENELTQVLGPVPEPDFQQWQSKFLQADQPVAIEIAPAQYRRDKSKWTLLLKLVASVVFACGLIWWALGGFSGSHHAFAAEIPGVDTVNQITWTQVPFVRVTSEDGKRTWLRKERSECAYQHPGKYRTTYFGEDGKPSSVHITDTKANRTLLLNLVEREAVLKVAEGRPDSRGPFAWVGDLLRGKEGGTVSIRGTHKFDNIDCTDVLWKATTNGEAQVSHFYFDLANKKLTGINMTNPGEKTDLESTVGEIQNPAEEKWSTMTPIGARVTDINLYSQLDKSMFSLDPPSGYKLENVAPPTVTEDELLEYLAAAADFNNGVFPDSFEQAFDSKKFNEASIKNRTDRSSAENRLIDIRDKIMMREIYRSPVLKFLEDHAVANSSQYVGADVKVGEADKLIFWYKPKGSSKHRGFYGDLKIKDLAESDLPIKL